MVVDIQSAERIWVRCANCNREIEIPPRKQVCKNNFCDRRCRVKFQNSSPHQYQRHNANRWFTLESKSESNINP